MVTQKSKIISCCIEIVNQKLQQLDAAYTQINEAIAGETKSTAGDKHETAKAILQAEQEKLSKQIQLCQTQKADLEKINPSVTHTHITKGSLVTTNNGLLFTEGGLGKLQMDDITFISISPQSPLALKLNGLKTGDNCLLNQQNWQILGIE